MYRSRLITYDSRISQQVYVAAGDTEMVEIVLRYMY